MKGFSTLEEQLQQRDIPGMMYEEFVTIFNRLYFSKQYTAAFDFCINHLVECDYKEVIITKAKLAIEKMTNRINLTNQLQINQDWVLDAFVSMGKTNMSLDGDKIFLGASVISTQTQDDKFMIAAKCRFNKFVAFLIFCVIFGISGAIAALIDYHFYDVSSFLTLVVFFGSLGYFTRKLYKLYYAHRSLIRQLANVVLQKSINN
jgi:hypothetical protein